MSLLSNANPANALDPTSSPAKRGRWMPQIGIRTIMLLIAVTAVWTAFYTGQKSIERDRLAVEAMHAFAPELFVRNRHEYACLQIDRSDDIREFQCYLPPNHEYKLQLLWSKEFGLNDPSLQAEVSAPMTAGEHRILMNELPEKLIVSVDAEVVMEVPKKRPDSRSSLSTGVSDRFDAQWHPLDQPLTLLRLSEGLGQRQGPVHGIVLWIDTDDQASIKK